MNQDQLKLTAKSFLAQRIGITPSDVVLWQAVDEPDGGGFPVVIRVAASFEKEDKVDKVIVGTITFLEDQLISDGFNEFTKKEFQDIIQVLGPVL
jgi:hypothetical protein